MEPMEPVVTESQTLHNENVRFTIHYKPACVVEFDMEALEPLVADARKKAIRAISKEVVLAGFRKGKAPDAMVAKNFPNEIDKEWQQKIADGCLAESLKLSHMTVLEGTSAKYQIKSHSPSGALLTLSFETLPKIPHVDPKHMQLKSVKRPEVNEEKIEETIRQARLFFATWTPVEDRPIQEGDFVRLDVDVIEDTPPTSLFDKVRFEVTAKSMAQWMRELVLGKQAGESVEGISVPDEDASAEDKEKLQPKKVRITIHGVETAEIPAFDDSFAQMVGAANTDAVKTNITNLLNKQADEHVLAAEREQVNTFLLTQYPFDLPATLVSKEANYRFHYLSKDAEFRSYWESLPKEEQRKTIQMVFDQAEKAVRIFYLCRQILTDAQINISPADLPKASDTTLDALLNTQEDQGFNHPETAHAEAFSRLVHQKAEDFIIRNATRI